MIIINFIDSLLNRITMYRLVLYFLLILVAVAAIFGLIGWLPYSPLALVFSMFFLFAVCWASNELFAYAFSAQPNLESHYITALILTLILTPVLPWDLSGIAILAWAGVWAIASKYLLAIDKKHIFNPAAFGAVVIFFTLNGAASWWIGGNLVMLPFVVIGGLLVTRKIQRFDLVFTFVAAAIASFVLTNLRFDPVSTVQKALLHTPIFFFAFIMITEPLTTPPRRHLRIIYGAIIGALFSPAIQISGIHMTPELALLAANIFAYFASPKGKLTLPLVRKEKMGVDMYDFAFATGGAPIKFHPGQYMEWTLGHKKTDTRGNRRYFTIASSPTESELHLGVKFYDPSSSFKKAMLALEPGARVVGGQLAGDFVLPSDPRKKLVFIAGGIGITPFRSMAKYLTDRGEKRDVVLLYSNRTTDEIAYREVFDEAAHTFGMKTVYAITDKNDAGYTGRIDAALVAREIPDYRERTFYISGTHAMVVTFKKTLSELGVPYAQIKTDFFPGFA